MNSAGLSSICQGTNGLNGSALRAILSTFDTGLVLALALVPGVGDPVPVLAGAQALRSNAAMVATAMACHPVFRRNMNLSLPRKGFQNDRVESATASPPRALAPVAQADRIILGSPTSHPPIPRISAACSSLNPGRKVGSEEVRR